MPSLMEFKGLRYLFIVLNCLLVVLLFFQMEQIQDMKKEFLNTIEEKDNQIDLSRKENKQKDLRIDKVIEAVEGIANTNQAVGNALKEVLIDLKENKTFGIDQKISDLPTDMQEMIIIQNIDLHGLRKYKIFDERYIMPVDVEKSYIPVKWGEFGYRPQLFDENYQYIYNPNQKVTKWTIHPANDIVSINPEIKAVADGRVIKTGWNESGGKYIWISHDEGKKQSRYYHLQEVKVEKNDIVSQGDIIGLIGNTGRLTTGQHLHFEFKEIKNGRWVYKNFLVGTTHNRKYHSECYYYKSYYSVTLEDGTIEKKYRWKIKLS